MACLRICFERELLVHIKLRVEYGACLGIVVYETSCEHTLSVPCSTSKYLKYMHQVLQDSSSLDVHFKPHDDETETE